MAESISARVSFHPCHSLDEEMAVRIYMAMPVLKKPKPKTKQKTPSVGFEIFGVLNGYVSKKTERNQQPKNSQWGISRG